MSPRAPRRLFLGWSLVPLLLSATHEGVPVALPAVPESQIQARTQLVPSSGIDDLWWRTVVHEIAGREREVEMAPDGFRAFNRANHLRASFRDTGVEIRPNAAVRSRPWIWSWRTQRFGRPGSLEPVADVAPAARGATVSYDRDQFVEWYENRSEGIEQGFTVHGRPDGEGPLCIEAEIDPRAMAVVRADDRALAFADEDGVRVFDYRKLEVWDDTGRRLEARLVGAHGVVRIEVDDEEAVYPILIDPLMTSPAWTAQSDQTEAAFGFSVATAGDVNGDGFSDLIVGARFYDNGETDEGAVFVYEGSPSGLSTSPAWSAEGEQDGAEFGYAAATAGDVNGDGYSDVIIGAPFYDNDQSEEGRVYVYLGSPAGLAASPAWMIEGDLIDANLGFSVATAGDVNGDGYWDVIVGAPLYDDVNTDGGRAFVYAGADSGLAATPLWSHQINQEGAAFGCAVGTAGDVNGDGYSDVIVGARAFDGVNMDGGAAFVYLGSGSGPGAFPAWFAVGDQPGAEFGGSVATAGDVNGDGYSDVIVGAALYDHRESDEGRAYAYYGSSLGLSGAPAWMSAGDEVGAEFGRSVATAGDVNGDGHADVIIGAWRYSNSHSQEGRALVYEGSPDGLLALPVWTAEGNQEGAEFGFAAATAGDVNGDGFSDVVVGAPSYESGELDEGWAYVYHGSGAGLALSAAWADESDHAGGDFGISVATAGDVNGDGFSDVIIGARFYDNGQIDEGLVFVYHGSPTGLEASPAWFVESNQDSSNFGYSVSTAGDVNGDGYSDVIIGAYDYDNGENNEGAAFVYLGSPSGLEDSPVWTGEGNQVSARYGVSVSTAGDVNGDGYSDVIVGAYGHNGGQPAEGRVYVYHGSPQGPSPVPSWVRESNRAWTYFGASVSTAGDVNGDGYSDVLIGAIHYSNVETREGQASVFHGSPTGLSNLPDWAVESNQEDAVMGWRVSTAGDVNGDGFSDVIIGAQGYDDDQLDEGRVFVHHGSPNGLGLQPAWTVDGNQDGAELGFPVATAGDVNGDGYSDIALGAWRFDNTGPDQGRTFVYHGSSDGLLPMPSWVVEGDQSASEFGFSLGTAGDVNGDRFSDLIVGSPAYDHPEFNEGQCFVYLGNNGDGVERSARMERVDELAPIWLLGASDSETSFRLKVRGQSPAGRGTVRLQSEVKPASVPFDGTGLETGAGQVALPGSGVLLNEVVEGLDPNSLYRWRLRIVTDSPFFPRSPWLWLPYNGASEADVRTARGGAGVAGAEAGPVSLRLGPGSPNPFSPATELGYSLPRDGRVRFRVFDLTGRQVAVLVDEVQPAGSHTVRWDGRDWRGNELPAGTYFARLEFGGRVESRKIVRLR